MYKSGTGVQYEGQFHNDQTLAKRPTCSGIWVCRKEVLTTGESITACPLSLPHVRFSRTDSLKFKAAPVIR